MLLAVVERILCAQRKSPARSHALPPCACAWRQACGAEECAHVSPHDNSYARRVQLHRRIVRAVAAGALLVSAVAIVLVGSSRDAPRAMLQEQLQFMYASPYLNAEPVSALPILSSPMGLPLSPTLLRAAGAIARAQQAVGTAYLRSAFPHVLTSQVMSTRGMPGIVAAPFYGAAPARPTLAYHVSIPTGSTATGAAAGVRGAGPFWGGVPQVSEPMGYEVPQPAAYVPAVRGPSAQDLAVNAAIAAGANAAAGVGGAVATPGLVAAPYGATYAAPYGATYAAPYGAAYAAPYGAAPTVSVQTPTQTVTMSPWAPGAPPVGVPMLPGAEKMKIVAGPGKGKIVEVTSAGAIVGEHPQVRAVAAGLGVGAAQPMMRVGGAWAGVQALPAAFGAMPPLLSMRSVVENPYHRLSGKEQAAESAQTAAQAGSTAQSALASTTQGAKTGEADAGEIVTAGTPATGAVPEHAEIAASDDLTPGAPTFIATGEGEEGKRAKDVVAHALKDMLGGQAAEAFTGREKQGERLALSADGLAKQHKLSGLLDAAGSRNGADGIPRRERGDVSSEITREEQDEMKGRPEVLVTVPHGKQPGDFFSAEVAGRGSMLIEVPEGVRGGDDLQLLQMPTYDGEALEWVKYAPKSVSENVRGEEGGAAPRVGPSQVVVDRNAAARDSIRSAWSLGDRAPRSYFH